MLLCPNPPARPAGRSRELEPFVGNGAARTCWRIEGFVGGISCALRQTQVLQRLYEEGLPAPGRIQQGSGWVMVLPRLLRQKRVNWNAAERCCCSWRLGQFKL